MPPPAPAPAPARAPAPAAPAPAPAGAAPAGANASPPPAAPEKLDKGAIKRLIAGAQPGYDEGAGALADKWLASNKNEKPQVEAAVAAPTLKTEILTAWRTSKAGSDQAFVEEYGRPDPVAVQKFADLNGEAYWDDSAGKGDLAGARKGLYQAVAESIVSFQTDRARIFPLMTAKRFPYVFAGKKITAIPALTRRTHSVGGLARGLNSAAEAMALQRGLEMIATKAGVPVATIQNDPGAQAEARTIKMQAIRDILRSGAMTPKAMAVSSNKLSEFATWFTPGGVTTTPGGDAGYAELMVLGALQPDWYPDGTVLVEIDTVAAGPVLEARKPTAFDGLLSALWVSRNQGGETYGVTGGGAQEYLMTGPTWANVTQSSAQIPSESNLQEIVAASERIKAQFGSTKHGTGPRGTTDTTSTGEEVMRGNGAAAGMPAGGFGAGVYADVIATSRNQAQSTGAAAPGGVMAAGGGGGGAAPGAPGAAPARPAAPRAP